MSIRKRKRGYYDGPQSFIEENRLIYVTIDSYDHQCSIMENILYQNTPNLEGEREEREGAKKTLKRFIHVALTPPFPFFTNKGKTSSERIIEFRTRRSCRLVMYPSVNMLQESLEMITFMSLVEEFDDIDGFVGTDMMSGKVWAFIKTDNFVDMAIIVDDRKDGNISQTLMTDYFYA